MKVEITTDICEVLIQFQIKWYIDYETDNYMILYKYSKLRDKSEGFLEKSIIPVKHLSVVRIIN